MDYAAVVGGCAAASTVLGSRLANTQPVATVSGALVQLLGDPVKATLAFDRAVAPDVQRVAYVDPRRDVVAQVVELARSLKGHLGSVRLARVPGGRPIQADTVLEARRRMDAAGARNVTIVVSGRLSPERIRTLLDNDAPVDVFHDTGYIAAAKPLLTCRTSGPSPTGRSRKRPSRVPRTPTCSGSCRTRLISATRQLGHFLALRRADCPCPYVPILLAPICLGDRYAGCSAL